MAVSRLVPVRFAGIWEFVMEFSDFMLKIFRDGEAVFRAKTPYPLEEVAGLRFAQPDGDDVIIAHPKHAPKKLSMKVDV